MKCPRCTHEHDPEYLCEMDCLECAAAIDERLEAEQERRELLDDYWNDVSL